MEKDFSDNTLLKKVQMYKVTKEVPEQMSAGEDEVLCEHILEIYLDGERVDTMTCTECALEDLAVGYLWNQGYIDAYKNVKGIMTRHDDAWENVTSVEVETIGSEADAVDCEADATGSEMDVTGSEADATSREGCIEGVRADASFVDYDKIMELSEKLLTENELFDRTGSMHGAAIADTSGEFLYTGMDFKRHNAVDKVVGWAVLNGVNLKNCILFTTGRIPLDMMSKAVAAGVCGVVSRGAVTLDAIELAKENKIMLCGFSRGKRLNIYARR